MPCCCRMRCSPRMSSAAGLVPVAAASAAPTPAICPVTRQQYCPRVHMSASWVTDSTRPPTVMPSTLLGTKTRHGISYQVRSVVAVR